MPSSIKNQEITDELWAFGAVVGPEVTRCATLEAKGIDISQLDLKDAVVGEIFCKKRFTSRALSFGLLPGFAIDYTTKVDFDEPDQEAEAFKLRETMQPKLLVGPQCESSSQQQSLSKDKQLLEVKRMHPWRHLGALAQVYHGHSDDHNNFLHEHSKEPSRGRNIQSKKFSFIFRGETVSTGSATIRVPQV